MNNQALQREAKRLVDYIVSLGNDFQIVTAQPETHIGVIITDAVLQVGHRWKTHVGPRVQRIKSKYPQAATTSGILTLLQTIGTQQLLNWKGTDEQKRFRQTVDFFHHEGIDSSDDLRAWLASDDNRDRLITKSSRDDRAGIDKIGDKTADYYRVMVGIPDAVAIDSYIRAFLKDADVKGGSQYDTERVIVQLAAPMLSAVENKPIRPVDLDQSIWGFQSQKQKRNRAGHTTLETVTAPEERRKEEYEMNKSHQVLEVTLPPDTMKLLERIAENQFGIKASTLAQVWIVERLKQLCIDYQPPPADVPAEEPPPPASLPKKYMNIKITRAMVKGKAIVFYKSQQIPFKLPPPGTQVTLLFKGKEYTRTYQIRPLRGFQFAPIFRSGISAGNTIKVIELVPFKKYEVS